MPHTIVGAPNAPTMKPHKPSRPPLKFKGFISGTHKQPHSPLGFLNARETACKFWRFYILTEALGEGWGK